MSLRLQPRPLGSNSEASPDASAPKPASAGQRQLAVIMFTDAVSYSARMHAEEVVTLEKVGQDIDVQRQLIATRGGTILKGTGDGLLIQFSSAVEAVTCGLEIQRFFLERERKSDNHEEEHLRYRIGVHLGDVFVGNGDVMGDGVNITARLVGKAPAGGMVISQTVYDVVKNKMELHTTNLGQPQLKNIKEKITVYEVLTEAPTLKAPKSLRPREAAPVSPVAAASTPLATPAFKMADPEPAGTPGWQKMAAILAIVGVLGGAGWYLWKQHLAVEESLAAGKDERTEFRELAKKETASTDVAPVNTPAATSTTTVPVPAKVIYNFAALTTKTPAGRNPTAETLPIVQEAEATAGTVLRWLPEALSRYNRDRTLLVLPLGNNPGSRSMIFSDANKNLFFALGGATRKANLNELDATMVGAIIVAALGEANLPANSELWRSAEAFAYLHGQPEMIKALQR